MAEKPSDAALQDRIGELLLAKKQTVAVAESVTAGHLQVALSLAQNAMEFFQGGITVYNLGQKTRHLHVEPVHALACNCVSEKVAAEMAKNATSFFLSNWGLAITGYASPVPEQNIHRLFACYAIYSPDAGMTTQTIHVENDSPARVRQSYTDHVLHDFFRLLQQ
jgi:nicotinamide-nucleotide amidase